MTSACWVREGRLHHRVPPHTDSPREGCGAASPDLLNAFLTSYDVLQQAKEAAERRRLEGGLQERNARAKAQEERMARLAGLPPVRCLGSAG